LWLCKHFYNRTKLDIFEFFWYNKSYNILLSFARTDLAKIEEIFMGRGEGLGAGGNLTRNIIKGFVVGSLAVAAFTGAGSAIVKQLDPTQPPDDRNEQPTDPTDPTDSQTPAPNGTEGENSTTPDETPSAEQPSQNGTDQSDQETNTGTYKILSEQEQRAIFDKYNFNSENRSVKHNIQRFYDIETDSLSPYLNNPIGFDMPTNIGGLESYDRDHDYGEDQVDFFVYPKLESSTAGQYLTGAGNIRVQFGAEIVVKPTNRFYEKCTTETFKVNNLEGYVQSARSLDECYYLIYLRSNDINNGEPFLLCNIETNLISRGSLTGSELEELSNAIVSRIVQTAHILDETPYEQWGS
jgi:hypothetical protein